MSKLIIANWKMNPSSQKEVDKIVKGFLPELKKYKNIKVVICAPFTFIFLFKKTKNNKLFIGAQNVSASVEGAYTGEVSSKMLSNMGVKYAIVGHSESRKTGESNELINKKIISLLKSKITPILCVGESKRDSDGFYLSFVGSQIKECLHGILQSQLKNIVIAYEPVWAIGKEAKRQATKEEFIEMKIFIKKIISDIYNSKTAHSVPIIYGGSVSKDNAYTFCIEGEADGLLVGRDSLNPKKFNAILNALN